MKKAIPLLLLTIIGMMTSCKAQEENKKIFLDG